MEYKDHFVGMNVLRSSIFINKEITETKKEEDHCGSCSSCIDVCPTKAISEPFVVNAHKCLAYHNIENRSLELPKDIQDSMGKWVAGCDICQDVCPWNQKAIAINNEDSSTEQKKSNKATHITQIRNVKTVRSNPRPNSRPASLTESPFTP